MSKALALRNIALHLAARDAADLDLAGLIDVGATLRQLVQEAVEDARTILLLGASSPGLAAALVSAAVAQDKKLWAIEADPKLLQSSAAPGSGGQAGPAVTLLSADPMDLRIDPRTADGLVAAAKPNDYAGYLSLAARIADHAAASPLLADESVDVVVVDMLMNRLAAANTARVLAEAFRVLRRSGRLLAAALLADERLSGDAEADFGPWRATRLPLEAEAAAELGSAGFHGMSLRALAERPVRTVKGIELRAFLIDGYKGKQGVCLDQGHAVVYRGPWRDVLDDDGHRYARGERTAVCAKTYGLLMREPYRGQFIGLPAYVPVPLEQAPLFDCNTPALRDPAVTKGRRSVLDAHPGGTASPDCCAPAPGSTGTCCE